ncbi:hypothetical protein P350_23780 [Burkholderia cepacia JBK9]|nr:hypothetical protein P350_23780 [Burkholderia cepacia JBK9]
MAADRAPKDHVGVISGMTKLVGTEAASAQVPTGVALPGDCLRSGAADRRRSAIVRRDSFG